MARAKHFEFPASVEWEGGSMTVASIAGKQDLDVATPPEFGGENEGAWSPEDLLVASAATCFAVTLTAILRRGTIPLLSSKVEGTATSAPATTASLASPRSNSRLLRDRLGGRRQPPRNRDRRAESGCLVAMALSVPVHVQATVTAPSEAAPLARTRRRLSQARHRDSLAWA